MESGQSSGIDVREYLRIVRRHLWLILIVTVACGVAAFMYSNHKTPLFAATASLIYEQPLDITDPLGGSNADAQTQQMELENAVTIIDGSDIYGRVAEQLGAPATWPPYSVSAEITVSDSATSGSTGTGLAITASSPDAKWATRVANLYATEFVAWRVENERQRIEKAQQVIDQQLKEFTTPAQKLTAEYLTLVNRQRDLQILWEVVTGNFRSVTKATEPSVPYSPKPMRTGVMGAAAGLILGCCLAFLREKLDTSLRSHREVAQIMDLPVVGRIPRIPEDALSKGALVVISEAEGRAAESLRVLRSNLEFVSMGDEHRVLMICSAQKGEGKSLVTANLAASLALAGKKVVLIDADLRRPRVHRLFSVRNTAGVSSIIAGQSTLAEALQEHVLLPGAISVGGNGKGAGRERSSGGTPDVTLTLLTAGPIPPNPGEMVASQRFAELVAELRTTDFDYIIIDSPAFLAVGDAAALGAVADGIFLLVNLKMTGRPMLEDARDFLAQLPAKRLGVITVIDQSAGDERYHYYGGKY